MNKYNRQKTFLKAEAILKYLKGNDDLHTLITAKSSEVELVTTDQSLYEALGSVDDRSTIDMNLLVKMLEVTTVVPYEQVSKGKRHILSPERAEQLRKQTE